MSRSWLLSGIILFIVVGCVLFPFVLGVPVQFTFTGDAAYYSTGARNLLYAGFYSFDGVTPFLDREPGMSFFLLPLYFLFGVENPVALYLAQGALLLIAAWLFCRQFARIAGDRAAGICFLLLLTSGSVFHTVFSAYRECLVLTLFLFFGALYLSGRAGWKTVLLGLILGAVILTYYSFVFLPAFLLLVWIRERRPLKEFAAMMFVCALVVVPWAFRNYAYDGRFRIVDNRRAAVMWYVRGEQAELVHGLEPLRCLWSEYVSRDWTGRSPACSFNGVMNTHWSNGFDLQADYSEEGRIGQRKILRHPFAYLWFSVFEIVELHLPFLGGGWSHAYNVYASLTAAALYAGFFAGLRRLFDPALSLLLGLTVYNTAVYILTDATPRYLLPVIFCYAAIAGIGYDKIFLWLRRR